MKPCEHRHGKLCNHPLNEKRKECVMQDPRAADCRWWKSNRVRERVIVTPWAQKKQSGTPAPLYEFVGPPKPHVRTLQRRAAAERRQNLEEMGRARKLASPFDALLKGTK